MTRSQIPSQRLAVVAGLVSFAAIAGNANAQMNDVRSVFNRNSVQAHKLGENQAPRTDVGLAAGACASGQFEQINQAPNGINGFFSEAACGLCGGPQVVADDFILTNNTNVLNIQFFGGYFPSNTLPADAFTVVIRADNGGCAGAALHTLTPATTRVATGNVLFGVNEYCYDSTITGVSLVAGTYWVEIFNNTTTSADDWFWETGNLDFDYGTSANGFAFEAPGVNWNCPLGNDFSLIVCGDVAQDPPPPPGNECTSGSEAADQDDNGVNGFFSEASCSLCGGPQVMTDNFVTGATGGNLCEINFYGGYFPTNNVPATDSFTIRLHTDTGAGIPADPGTTLAHTVLSRTTTGDVLFGVDEYFYVVDVGSVPLAPNTVYWLEIYNDTTSSPDDWFWETGNPGNGTVSGCAFAFVAPGDNNWNAFGGQELTLRVCLDCGVGTKYCTATNNSTGSPADITASGSASSSAGTLQLDAAPVPNQNGIFFHGANQSQVTFGNGFLCATGGIVRGAVIAGSGNAATYTYDNSDAKHNLGGFVNQTRNFQYWFRDPMGGGSFFNTSNAIEIAILP